MTSDDPALVCLAFVNLLMSTSEGNQIARRGHLHLRPVLGVLWGVIVVMSCVCALVYLYWHDPETVGAYPQCVFRSVTGFWCPGCGLTRGLYACLHGDIFTAIKMNPLVFVVAPVLAAIVCVARHTSTLKMIDVLACVLCLLFWGFRNVPFWPFSLLSPQ